jgi:pimeloyl-ACP methyl ester carboxylesterase
VDVGGMKLRYVKAGSGPNLVLLHTLRTQLDLFERILPDLAKHFTVYALDYPGYGYSDIPKAQYDADFFVSAVKGFLNALDLRDVMLCGVSIGGTVYLVMLGRRNPRVAGAVAINPYDYAKGARYSAQLATRTNDYADFWDFHRRRNGHASEKLHHHESGSARRGCEFREYLALSLERNV